MTYRDLDYQKIADALEELDAHTVYGREALFPLAHAGIDVSKLSSSTPEQVLDQMRMRGLGGSLRAGIDSRERLYTGHVVSDDVLTQLGLVPAGRAFYGRGSAHRANIAQLRNLNRGQAVPE